jgi:hypothetical protein
MKKSRKSILSTSKIRQKKGRSTFSDVRPYYLNISQNKCKFVFLSVINLRKTAETLYLLRALYRYMAPTVHDINRANELRPYSRHYYRNYLAEIFKETNKTGTGIDGKEKGSA